MKRKRGGKVGDKKGKKKKLAVVASNLGSNLVYVNEEDNFDVDNVDDDFLDSTEDHISSNETGRENQDTTTAGDKSNDRPVSGVGRVKVKLKPSRMLDPHRTPSETQTQSDTDKSSPQMALEKQEEIVEKVDFGVRSTPTAPNAVFTVYSSRKASSMKIKSSVSLGSQTQEVRTCVLSDLGSTVDSQEGKKLPHPDQGYNEKELVATLGVIKKVMKMDAAEPFNAPVDPVALGIPDYFDIIKTPMDFGTICENLEHGEKYMNSQDVFKDVECIWDNCLRYNNKGDYIMDLMKRVKKNFMKQWTEAGLYSGPSTSTTGSISAQMSPAAPSSQEKSHPRAIFSKQKKRGRHGIDLHKSDCLCAVCVVRRRKRERTAQMKENKVVRVVNSSSSFDYKKEEKSPGINSCGEDTSVTLDQSLEHDEEDDIEVQGDADKLVTNNELDISYQDKQEISGSEMDMQEEEREDKPLVHEYAIVEVNDHEVNDLDVGIELNDRKEENSMQGREEEDDLRNKKAEQRQLELAKQLQKTQMLMHGNPAVLSLCKTLFSSNSRSVWSGPHSLACQRRSPRDTPIQSALAMFMK